MHEMTSLARPYIRPAAEAQKAVYLGYYFNLGFAVELYLKAYIRDVTAEDVSTYRHDLDALFEAARKLGFPFATKNIMEIVELIGAEHKALRFRYAEGASEYTYINELDLVEAALSACRDGLIHLR